MRKIFLFAWQQVYTVFLDRGLLLFMLLTPLLIATIIGLAFSGGEGGSLSISDLEVAVVNLDEGAENGTNYGQAVTNILSGQPASINPNGADTTDDVTCESTTDDTNSDDQPPQFSGSLDDLLNTTVIDTADAARAGVENGTYAAAVIIPADFSSTLSPGIDFSSITGDSAANDTPQTTVDIYSSSGSAISGSVIRSVTESIVNQIVTGTVTINSTIATLTQSPANILALSTADQDAFAAFGCAFQPDSAAITLDQQPVNETQERTPFVQILVAMGSAQAVFFALFTANNAILTIYQDRDSWILQRLFITPTPRWYFLAGKILGTLFIVLIQVGLLLIFLTLVASLIMQQLMFIWGSNILLLLLLTLLVGFAVAGLGVFIVGIANDTQQAQLIGTLVAMGMAIVGGAFGFAVPTGQELSIIYWGVDAYESLSAGSTDIGLNLLVLGGSGLVLFSVGSWLFSRRIEI